MDDRTFPYVWQLFEVPPPWETFTPQYTACEWKRQYGLPTDDNLREQVQAFAKSLEQGGANFHLTARRGYIPYPTSAEIRENRAGGRVVATWKAGTFQVW